MSGIEYLVSGILIGMSTLPEREIRPRSSESVTVVEVSENPAETPAEKEGLVQRIDVPVLEKPVTSGGQVVVTSPTLQQPKIVLPLSSQSYLNPKNWHKPVTSALSWLLRWVKRLREIYPGRTVFNQ